MHNKENCSPFSNGGFGANTNSATAQMQSNGGVFASLYSTLFNEDNPSPSSGTCNNNGGSLYPYKGLKYAATESGIRQSQYSHDSMVIQKHQDMVNRHSICLSRLVETSGEVETLRQENSQLRAINRELQKQLSLFFHASIEDRFGGSSGHNTTPFDLAQGFRGVHIGDDSCRDGKENNCSDWNNNNNNNNNKEQEQEQDQDQVSEESPSSVIENNNGGGVEVERFSLPKSISVRSNGYLKLGQSAGTGAGTGTGNRNTKGDTRPRTPLTTPPEVVQKVYVRGGKKEEEPLEMVVYNQGMFKTELCNKWQETGACPYGYHCQFAHGIGELRPVIRHPRYKTEVCRMVLAGVACPYGHRCHFRHALTEEEKAIAQQKLRTLKLER